MSATTQKKARRPWNIVKSMELALGTVLIAIIGLLALGFYPVSHPRITRLAVETIRKQGLDSCEFGKATVAVWKGVSFHDVAVVCTTGAGDRYAIKAPVLTVKCNLFMLGVRYGPIKKVVDRELKSLAAGNRTNTVEVLQSVLRIAGSSEYIKGMAVSGADVTVEPKRGVPRGVKGAALDVWFPKGDASRVSGEFNVGTLFWSIEAVARQVSGDFSYDSGTIALTRFKAKTFGGRVKLETRLNILQHTINAFDLEAESIDLHNWSRFSDTTMGRLRGKVDLRFTLDSSSLATDSLRGKGSLSVARFEIIKFPFQRSLVTMLMYPGLAHLNFKKFKADLKLKPGKLIETDAKGEGDTLSVKADGWIRTDGLLNEKLECTLTKAGVRTLPPFAQKTLEDGPGGTKVLKCRIYGMIQYPKVSVESKVILQKAVNNMFEEVKNNLHLWMR